MFWVFVLGCHLMGQQGGQSSDTWQHIDLDSDATDSNEGVLDLPQGHNPCRKPVEMGVGMIFDGDTARMEPILGGAHEDVRFIGVDTPEIAHGSKPADCGGNNAHEYTAQNLKSTVWLTFDSECTDAYDRTLAYVHQGKNGEEFFNLSLVQAGHARVLTISPNDTFSQEFIEAEGGAEKQNIGLWGECGGS